MTLRGVFCVCLLGEKKLNRCWEDKPSETGAEAKHEPSKTFV